MVNCTDGVRHVFTWSGEFLVLSLQKCIPHQDMFEKISIVEKNQEDLSVSAKEVYRGVI